MKVALCLYIPALPLSPFLFLCFSFSVIHELAQRSRPRCHEPDEKCYITRTPNSILCLRLVVMRRNDVLRSVLSSLYVCGLEYLTMLI